VQLKERQIELKETTAMLRYSGGDARKLLNILDLVVQSETADPVVITDEMVTERLQQNPLACVIRAFECDEHADPV
jgi:putative ATPase